MDSNKLNLETAKAVNSGNMSLLDDDWGRWTTRSLISSGGDEQMMRACMKLNNTRDVCNNNFERIFSAVKKLN